MDKENFEVSGRAMWRRLSLVCSAVVAAIVMGAGPLMAQGTGAESSTTPTRQPASTTTVARAAATRAAPPLPQRAVPRTRGGAPLAVQLNSSALKGQVYGVCEWGKVNCVMEIMSHCPPGTTAHVDQTAGPVSGGHVLVACMPD